MHGLQRWTSKLRDRLTGRDAALERITFCAPSSNLAVLAIPKAASSSIVRWLLAAENIAVDPQADMYARIRETLLLRDHPTLAAPLRITLLRNPFTRLASAYVDKFVREGVHHPAQRIARALDRERQGPTFREFCRFLAGSDLRRVDVHWRSQHSMVTPFAPTIVGRVEALAEFEAAVSEALGTPFQLHRQNASGMGVSATGARCADVPALVLRERSTLPAWPDLYDDTLVTFVRRHYAQDLQLGGYDLPESADGAG